MSEISELKGETAGIGATPFIAATLPNPQLAM